MKQSKMAMLGLALYVLCGVAQAAGDLATPQMEIGTNFWNIKWMGKDNRVFKTMYDAFEYEENPWNPAFLEQVSIYSCFRFMDFMGTNNTGPRSWADRTKKNDSYQHPVAYEWLIDLCNRSGADMWITVPHTANDSYVQNLATLIRENLDPNLQCWVEWSNETWNGMFDQAQYVIDESANLSSSILSRYSKSDNQWYRGQLYHAIRTLEVHGVFVDVFAGERDRLVLVMGGAVGHAFYRDSHCWAITDSEANPRGIMPDAYAVAPYVGHKVDPAASDVFEQILNTAIPEKVQRVKEIAEVVTELTAMQMVAYEGGQHLDMRHQKTLELQSDPRMLDVYMKLLQECSQYLTHFNHYVHMGGTWGAKHKLTDPLDASPKYKALIDWSEANNGSGTVHVLNPKSQSVPTMHTIGNQQELRQPFDIRGRRIGLHTHASTPVILPRNNENELRVQLLDKK
jgi:hypothetical protein